eukprot:5649373-Ditylum_brightwellii.AAC.1
MLNDVMIATNTMIQQSVSAAFVSQAESKSNLTQIAPGLECVEQSSVSNATKTQVAIWHLQLRKLNCQISFLGWI